ncbi:MAG: hypothetical protein IPO07_15865 [Haliscomenobacter sp.]|nr:hypothetical protein [Haliscomenobacter sp.]MBK9490077.1 hypothetical protein [Haliscomenobacter sp.]
MLICYKYRRVFKSSIAQWIFSKALKAQLFFSFSLLFLAQVNSAKPWAYWWWMGSAVNKADLKKNLEDFSAADSGAYTSFPFTV